jgi:hypothetical protein
MRRRLLRLALLAYPPEYRRERGAEILSTLDEMAPEGRTLRETCALVAGGLRTRAGTAGGRAAAGTIGDGLRIGAVMIVGGYALMLGLYAWQERHHAQPQHVLVAAMWLTVALLVFIGWRSAPGAVLLAAAITFAWQIHDGVAGSILLFDGAFMAGLALPAAGALWLAGRSSRSRPVSPLWLLAVVPQMLILTGAVDTPYGVYLSSVLVAISLPLVALALVISPADPRPAIAGCVLLVPVMTWLAAGSALGLSTFVPPLPLAQLALCTLPAVGLAMGGLVGACRLAQTLTP